MVARSARAARSAASASPKRPISLENTASVPRTTASPMSGAKAIDRIPARSKKSRCGAPSGKRSSAAYSSVTITRRSRIARWTPDPPTPSACHSAARLVLDAGVVRPVDLAGGRVEQVDHGARRAEQPGRLVHDVLEQLGRILDRHQAPGDLAQRPLAVGGSLQRALRRRQPVDEPRVGERDRGLAGQRVEQSEGVLAEGVAVAMPGLEHAHEAVLADDGRGDHRVQVDLLHALVALRVVLEPPVGHVVAGGHRPALADGEPGQADRLLVERGVEDRRIGERAVLRVRPDHRALDGLDEVEARPLRARAAGRPRGRSAAAGRPGRCRSSPGGRRSRAASAPPRPAGRAPRASVPAPRSGARARARPPTGRRWSRAARRRRARRRRCASTRP